MDGCEPRDRIWRALRTAHWLQGLPDPVIESLAGMSRLRRLGEGQLLYAKGDPPETICGVVAGRIRISVIAADGKEILVGIFESGSWFGYVSMLAGAERMFETRAAGDAEVLLISASKFQRLLEVEPRLYPNLVKLLSHNLRQSFEYIADAMFLPLSVRLAKKLLELAEAYGVQTADGRRIDRHLPQEDLGRMLGVSRQMVNSELQQWKRSRWIDIEYGRLVLRQESELRRLAATGNSSPGARGR